MKDCFLYISLTLLLLSCGKSVRLEVIEKTERVKLLSEKERKSDELEFNEKLDYRGKTINLLTFEDYLSAKTFKLFEELYGAKVKLTAIKDYQELLALVTDGQSDYDVTLIPTDMVSDLNTKGLLSLLDKSVMPNFEVAVNPENRMGTLIGAIHGYLTRKSSVDIALPYYCGVLGIAYNEAIVVDPPHLWSTFFNPSSLSLNNGVDLNGKISAVDEYKAFFLAYLSSIESLSVNALKNEEEKGILFQTLKTFPINFDNVELSRRLASGKDWLSLCWGADAAIARENNPKVKFIVPQGPKVTFVDCFVILKGASDPKLCSIFLDFMIKPLILAENINFSMYATPLPGARKYLDATILKGYSTPKISNDSTFIVRSDLEDLDDQYLLNRWMLLKSNKGK